MDLLIRNGTIVTHSGVYAADIAIEDGTIKHIGRSSMAVRADKIIDASGKLVLPGGIDAHTHFLNADDFRSGTEAAAGGGITTVIDFAQQVDGKTLRKVLSNFV